MKVACLYFSAYGRNIADYLRQHLEGDISLYSKSTYKEALPKLFAEYQAIIFISATGIAVRCSAPFLKDKSVDPAVIVIDDMGKYIISLLSGHLGRANQLTNTIAALLDAEPVITTASDNRGIDAVDMFAEKYGLTIENMDDAKLITAMMVDGRLIRLIAPKEYRLNYPHINDQKYDGTIIVSSGLRPKVFHVGIGCRRGKAKSEIIAAISSIFVKYKLALKSIKTIASIELKKDETGILEAARLLNAKTHFFPVSEIQNVQSRFEPSSFVESITETTSVCEPCAHLSGGHFVVRKQVVDGITIAVTKEG